MKKTVGMIWGIAALVGVMGGLGCAGIQDAGKPGGAGTGGAGAAVSHPPTADAGVDVLTVDSRPASGCGLSRFMVQRTPASVLLLLDRSASMKEKPSGAATSDTKWDLVVPALKDVVARTSGINWGYKTFPEGEGKECAADSVTSVINVPLGAGAGTAVSDALATTTPEGNGTPTADAVRAAATYLEGIKDGSRRHILLATDGEPSCPDDNADDEAVDAVKEALAQGIETYVVGIATTKKSATSTLNRLAAAGGVPAAGTSAAVQYYLASTASDLADALGKITGQVATCEFALSTPPPVPENIAVDVEGKRLPSSDSDGWSYLSAAHEGIRINGPSCAAILEGRTQAVQVTFGCPDEVIP